jgi:hypothetical protein
MPRKGFGLFWNWKIFRSPFPDLYLLLAFAFDAAFMTALVVSTVAGEPRLSASGSTRNSGKSSRDS